MKLLNIITPCSRPENLHSIWQSINIPKENYRWIVIYDGISLPSADMIPKNCELDFYYDVNSCYGNYQRNYAMDLIKEGHIYFNDDDTIIHPELWDNIKDLENDFITFNQIEKSGAMRLGDIVEVKVGQIDSHNFIFDSKISEGIRFVNLYEADGIFAEQVFKNSKSHINISKVLSIYNSLR
jgi:hypothetical protein